MCISTRNPDPALRAVVTTQQVLPTASGFLLVGKRALFFGEMLLVSRILLCDILLHLAYLSLSSSNCACKRFCVCFFMYPSIPIISLPSNSQQFCSYKLTQCCSNIPSPSAAEIPPWDVWSRWQLQLEASQAQTGHDLPVHIYRGASQCVGWRKEMCSIQLVLCLYSCKHNSLLTWKGALEDHSQCAFGWESMQMQGMRC